MSSYILPSSLYLVKSETLISYFRLKQKTQEFSSSQLTSWLNIVPGGSQIIPQLQKLKDVADKQGAQAEELAKETIHEIKQVLDKKKDKVEELYESGKQEAKKEQ